MKQSIRITSRVNKRLYADAIPGHFATNHSHINYYIDMSEIKHSMAMSREAARSIAYQFSSTSIDTLLCMEGTEYIGAYLAGELSSVGMGNVNSGKDIYLVEPDSNVNGQFVFSDNLRHMIEHRNVLVLVNSASTGQTFSQAKECVEYYGGRGSGFAALFSNISELSGKRSSACSPARIFRITRTLCAAKPARTVPQALRWMQSSPREGTISCNGQEESVSFPLFYAYRMKIEN